MRTVLCCGAAVKPGMELPKRARGLMGLMAAAITLLVPSVRAITTISLSSGDIETSEYNAFIARADKTVEWVTQNENYVMNSTYSVVIPVGYTLYFNPSAVFNELSRAYGSTPMFEVRNSSLEGRGRVQRVKRNGTSSSVASLSLSQEAYLNCGQPFAGK